MNKEKLIAAMREHFYKTFKPGDKIMRYDEVMIVCAEAALTLLDNEWARVEDDLPEDSMPVLCAHEYNGELFTGSTTYFHYDDMWFREDGTECSKRYEKITHWQPLPSPPKDK